MGICSSQENTKTIENKKSKKSKLKKVIVRN